MENFRFLAFVGTYFLALEAFLFIRFAIRRRQKARKVEQLSFPNFKAETHTPVQV